MTQKPGLLCLGFVWERFFKGMNMAISSAMAAVKPLALVLGIVALSGCKIIMSSTEGGYISSRTGDNDCQELDVCEIDVENGTEFSDTFTAVPNEGYVFIGWREGFAQLCGGAQTSCALEGVPGLFTDQDIDTFLTAEFAAATSSSPQ